MKTILIAIAVSLLSTSCMTSAHSQLVLAGPIDEAFSNKAQLIGPQTERVILTSPGGYPSHALQSATALEQASVIVIVRDICASACAEYLIPTAHAHAEQLIFEDAPIVGFHWNAAILEKAMMDNLDIPNSDCDTSDTEELFAHQQAAGVNPTFWQETQKRLGENRSQYRLDEIGCPQIKVAFENLFWLPTSGQLKALYGIDFSGSVCADNIQSCQHTIDQAWRPGSRMMIGNEPYVSGSR